MDARVMGTEGIQGPTPTLIPSPPEEPSIEFIADGLSKLRPKAKRVVTLRVQGLPYAEIAKEINRKQGAVRASIVSTYKKLGLSHTMGSIRCRELLRAGVELLERRTKQASETPVKPVAAEATPAPPETRAAAKAEAPLLPAPPMLQGVGITIPLSGAIAGMRSLTFEDASDEAEWAKLASGGYTPQFANVFQFPDGRTITQVIFTKTK